MPDQQKPIIIPGYPGGGYYPSELNLLRGTKGVFKDFGDAFAIPKQKPQFPKPDFSKVKLVPSAVDANLALEDAVNKGQFEDAIWIIHQLNDKKIPVALTREELAKLAKMAYKANYFEDALIPIDEGIRALIYNGNIPEALEIYQKLPYLDRPIFNEFEMNGLRIYARSFKFNKQIQEAFDLIETKQDPGLRKIFTQYFFEKDPGLVLDYIARRQPIPKDILDKYKSIANKIEDGHIPVEDVPEAQLEILEKLNLLSKEGLADIRARDQLMERSGFEPDPNLVESVAVNESQLQRAAQAAMEGEGLPPSLVIRQSVLDRAYDKAVAEEAAAQRTDIPVKFEDFRKIMHESYGEDVIDSLGGDDFLREFFHEYASSRQLTLRDGVTSLSPKFLKMARTVRLVRDFKPGKVFPLSKPGTTGGYKSEVPLNLIGKIPTVPGGVVTESTSTTGEHIGALVGLGLIAASESYRSATSELDSEIKRQYFKAYFGAYPILPKEGERKLDWVHYESGGKIFARDGRQADNPPPDIYGGQILGAIIDSPTFREPLGLEPNPTVGWGIVHKYNWVRPYSRTKWNVDDHGFTPQDEKDFMNKIGVKSPIEIVPENTDLFPPIQTIPYKDLNANQRNIIDYRLKTDKEFAEQWSKDQKILKENPTANLLKGPSNKEIMEFGERIRTTTLPESYKKSYYEYLEYITKKLNEATTPKEKDFLIDQYNITTIEMKKNLDYADTQRNPIRLETLRKNARDLRDRYYNILEGLLPTLNDPNGDLKRILLDQIEFLEKLGRSERNLQEDEKMFRETWEKFTQIDEMVREAKKIKPTIKSSPVIGGGGGGGGQTGIFGLETTVERQSDLTAINGASVNLKSADGTVIYSTGMTMINGHCSFSGTYPANTPLKVWASYPGFVSNYADVTFVPGNTGYMKTVLLQ